MAESYYNKNRRFLFRDQINTAHIRRKEEAMYDLCHKDYFFFVSTNFMNFDTVKVMIFQFHEGCRIQHHPQTSS